MKNIHYIGIVVILVILVALFAISPFSPLNKSSIDGHSVKLPSGYTVQNSSDSTLKISDGNNTLYIFSLNLSDTTEAVQIYHSRFDPKFNITEKKFTTDNGKKIVHTTAKEYNTTKVIHKYWFNKDDKVYNIQTDIPNNQTKETVISIISSF